MREGARAATAEDLPVVAALAEAAIEELTPHRGGAVWSRREGRRRPVAEGLAAQIADDGTVVVVGTIDDVVVGYGVAVAEELHDGARLRVVTDLFVLAGARGVGVGEAMMDHLVEVARAEGCVGIDSLALPGDRETKNFFETFGLTARAILVHRRLDAAADG